MNDNMTDSMWIKANSTRSYRIRRRGEVDGLGLIAATVVNISDCRREWSTRNIRMRGELPDTDEAGAQALKESDAIMKARMGEIYGQPMSARAVLNQLRQDAAKRA